MLTSFIAKTESTQRMQIITKADHGRNTLINIGEWQLHMKFLPYTYTGSAPSFCSNSSLHFPRKQQNHCSGNVQRTNRIQKAEQ